MTVKLVSTKYGLNSFTHLGATLWNRLPNECKQTDDKECFKKALSSLDIIKLAGLHNNDFGNTIMNFWL